MFTLNQNLFLKFDQTKFLYFFLQIHPFHFEHTILSKTHPVNTLILMEAQVFNFNRTNKPFSKCVSTFVLCLQEMEGMYRTSWCKRVKEKKWVIYLNSSYMRCAQLLLDGRCGSRVAHTYTLYAYHLYRTSQFSQANHTRHGPHYTRACTYRHWMWNVLCLSISMMKVRI